MDNTFKVVVAGSRDFNDYNFLKRKLDKLLSKQTRPVEIVSGGARGSTNMINISKKKGLQVRVYDV